MFIGSGIGGFGTIEREHQALMQGGPRRISPFFIPAPIINLAAGQVSIRFGAKGPNSATCTACSASAHAIGDAFEIIRRDDADVMIAGGSEAAITPMGVGGFAAMRALSTRNDEPQRASRPVRQGSRRLRHGRRRRRHHPRGARVRAPRAARRSTPSSSATACRPTPSTSPRRPRTATAACASWSWRSSDAGVRPEQVDYINAHGTSTPYNDKLETLAIKRTFGEHAHKLAISSTKSMTGHLLGAAGGLEAASPSLAIKHQMIPPTINYETPDPECDLDYVPNGSAPRRSSTRCRTRSASAARTARCCSRGMRNSFQLPASRFQRRSSSDRSPNG